MKQSVMQRTQGRVRKQSGFTLIELMIVVAIIGILAAIAIPQYQDYVARSQINSAYSEVSSLKTATEELIVRGEEPTLEKIGAPGLKTEDGSTTSITEFSSLTIEASGDYSNTKLKAKLDKKVAPSIKGAIITLERNTNGTWKCTIDTTAPGDDWQGSYMPSGCS